MREEGGETDWPGYRWRWDNGGGGSGRLCSGGGRVCGAGAVPRQWIELASEPLKFLVPCAKQRSHIDGADLTTVSVLVHAGSPGGIRYSLQPRALWPLNRRRGGTRRILSGSK